jgi:prepilin-type N-terminal cleavage/methylation domain-containing protein
MKYCTKGVMSSPRTSLSPIASSDGFTLLELLISITILAVIVTLIFGGLKIGVDAWEKAEKDIEENQRLRVLVELIGSQIASLYTWEKVRLPEQTPFFMKGGEKSLEFASLIPLLAESEGRPVHVRYEVVRDEESGKEQLLLYQKDLAFLGPEHEPKRQEGNSAPVTLVPEAEEILFQFLYRESGEEEPRWIKEWGEEKQGDLPLAVKVNMAYEGDITLFFLARPRCAVKVQ